MMTMSNMRIIEYYTLIILSSVLGFYSNDTLVYIVPKVKEVIVSL